MANQEKLPVAYFTIVTIVTYNCNSAYIAESTSKGGCWIAPLSTYRPSNVRRNTIVRYNCHDDEIGQCSALTTSISRKALVPPPATSDELSAIFSPKKRTKDNRSRVNKRERYIFIVHGGVNSKR
jgi:hypothetical protein